MPVSPQPDQRAPEPVGPTGAPEAAHRDQSGDYLTTAQGVRLPDTDHSLKAGERGPTLIEDFHLREKITHFDHERIPERVVHARGAAAHGVFESYGNASARHQSRLPGHQGPADRGLRPVLHRARLARLSGHRPRHPRASRSSSTPSRARSTWSATTSRSSSSRTGSSSRTSFTRPSRIRTARYRRLSRPTTRSGTSSSLHTEATHHVLWNMSDRGIPRSYRTMEGFGVHTFRLVNAEGETSLVKFHWKPVAGVHSLVWEEAQIAAGCRSGFPPSRHGRRHRSRRIPRVRTGHPGDARRRQRHVRRHRPARSHEARARGIGAGSTDREADAERKPNELFRRDRAGRVPHRSPGAGDRGHQRPADAGHGCSRISTPSSPGSAARTSRSCRSTGRTLRSTTCCVTACTRPPFTSACRLQAEQHRRRSLPAEASAAEGGYVQVARADRGQRRYGRRRHRSTTTSPRPRRSIAA